MCISTISPGKRSTAFDPAVSEWGNPAVVKRSTYRKSGSHPIHKASGINKFQISNLKII